MVEDNARIPINMTEPVELNLKMEAYTTIGDADEIYNRGYADGEEYGKANAPTEDLSVTLTSNGTYSYPKPVDKYHADVNVIVAVPSDKLPTQTKTIDIDENGTEEVVADSGYALEKVIINTDIDTRLPEQEKSIEVTENKVYEVTPDDGYALSKVTVTGNVASSGGDDGQLAKITTLSADEWNIPASTKTSFSELLKTIDFTEFNKLKHSNFFRFFRDYKGLCIDVHNLDTSKATNMSNMFASCSNITSLDLSSFDTSSVTSMSSMFSTCDNLTSLDLSNFDTSKVTNMNYIFDYCSKLTNMTFGNNWASNKSVTSFDMMYSPLSKASIIDLANKIADKSDKTIYTSTYKVTLKSSQKSLFTEEELTALANQFTAKNWTLAWG